ncbi:MAG: glycosyltransferase involved in cell wall biosynthesis [Saprospiraceae bacterium]|jgi:glycosyltransferase involved in cell wall biosynthesis
MKNRKRKIKIAFFADILVKDFDGASRTMFQIIERIPKDEFEFLFFCGMSPKEDIGHEVFRVPSIPIPFNSTYKLAIPMFSWFSMRKRLNEFRPDVIHIASPSPLGDFAFQYKRNRDIPVITIYHTHFLSYIGYYLRPLPFLVKTVLKTVAYGQKKFYDQSSLMYIPTMQMVEELKGFNFDTKKMKIWQRGMNHELFNPSKRDVPRIKELTQNGKPNVLFASRLVWEKNLATLIRIYRKSKDEGDKYNFIIAGDGVAEKPLTEKMPDAYMLGKVDHDTLAALYASADVFLFPSVSETYGNVVVEAMASGCPCVIAKGGGSQSLVVHGKTGFLCDPEDASDYLARIDQIIGDPSLRKELVSNGIEYTQSLNWESLCETYFDDVARLGSTGELPSDTVEV